jgi:hypothetical protein
MQSQVMGGGGPESCSNVSSPSLAIVSVNWYCRTLATIQRGTVIF